MPDAYNEPAFPVSGSSSDHQFIGMTLRDYFAAKALQGFCANSNHAVLDGPQEFQGAAEEAYALADAMLAERSKP